MRLRFNHAEVCFFQEGEVVVAVRNRCYTSNRHAEKIKPLDAESVIPSHGKPFRKANNRIEELLAHLEYLYQNNQCRKSLENGTWYYEAI